MDWIIGIVLIGVLAFQVYFFLSLSEKKEPEIKEKPKLTREEKKKQEELRKNFENLMNYDYEMALKRK